eukprot:6187525-Pleurochrysis_carterae.AAC.1
MPSNCNCSLRWEQNGLVRSTSRKLSKAAAAPSKELDMLLRSQTAELKSLPPIQSSPKGLIMSSNAELMSLPDVKTLNMRSGVPSSRCTLQRAVFARSIARVDKKFSRRTVSAAAGVKWFERSMAHRSRDAR